MFRVNEKITSYASPTIKVFACVAIIAFIGSRGYVFRIENEAVNVVISVISVVLLVLCVLKIYISCAEIILLAERRKNAKDRQKTYLPEDCVPYSVSEITELLKNNDIIDIAILNDGSCVQIGTSSNQKNGVSELFDKRYYIDTSEYDSISHLVSFLEKSQRDQCIFVISIDGLKPKRSAV